ncbi:MAG TPA: DUF4097 family beta strand repeat-containing protein [Candidatus Acidoferrales bacterium]|jgi:hypothetical protein|nr:DUF4097 family beta strand repeat-containing protein [Candidatus Acidoferrales bacterium]
MANVYPRRRRSIFSGLLLIVIGALFLAHNFNADLPIWNVLWRWWPIVFILWGVAKLYDHFMAQRSGEVAPPTVSAGEILLVLLLLGVLGGAWIRDWGVNHSGAFEDGGIFFGNTYSFTEEVPVQKIPANAHVVLRTTRGNITVHSEDAAEIKVTARKTARGDNEEEGKRRSDEVHMNISHSDVDYIIEPEGENGSSGGSVNVDLDVHVPKGATVNAQTTHGNIDITGAGGNVVVTGRSGDVAVRQTGGDVSVEVHSGAVTVTGAGGLVRVSGSGNEVEVADVKGVVTVDGEFYGPLRFNNAPKGVHFVSHISDISVANLAGRMEINGPGDMSVTDAPGDVTLTTSKRDLTLENVTGRIHVENRGGNVTVRFAQAPHDPVEISNHSGDIEVTMPEKSSFDVSARAHNGEIESDFGDLSSKITKERNRDAVLEGTVGAHGPKLDLVTVYGTIRLHKSQ